MQRELRRLGYDIEYHIVLVSGVLEQAASAIFGAADKSRRRAVES